MSYFQLCKATWQIYPKLTFRGSVFQMTWYIFKFSQIQFFFCDKFPWVARSKANISQWFSWNRKLSIIQNILKSYATLYHATPRGPNKPNWSFLISVNFQSKQQIIQNFRDMFQFRYYHLAAMIIKPVGTKKNVCSVFSNSNWMLIFISNCT